MAMAMGASSLSSFGGGGGGGGGPNVMLMRNDMGSSNSLVAMLTSCNPHVNFQVPRGGGGGLEDALPGAKRPYSCSPPFDPCCSLPLDAEGEDDPDEPPFSGGGCGGGPVEKKRRLSFDQVRSLERNFEVENKLEPERKMQLAKELGLQPRQVAVWFQNRRARWKIKQLERDYEMLNSGYLQLKADFETALREKDVLKAEVQRLSVTSQESPSVDSSQCDSESPRPTRKLPDLDVCKETPIFEGLVKNLATSASPTKTAAAAAAGTATTTSSDSHNSSSELLDPESPRTHNLVMMSAALPHHHLAGYCHGSTDSFAVGPGDADGGDGGDDDDAIVAVKLEEHGFPVDPSGGAYFLPPMVVEQPWWDWV